MAPWLALLEAYAVQALLRSPAFHRGVEKVVKGVHRLRHGIPPEEMGGTRIDGQSNAGFLKHFTEEIQTQLGRAEAKSESNALANSGRQAAPPSRKSEWSKEARSGADAEEESAEAVWQKARQQAAQPPKQGFLDEYMSALREQLKNGK